MRVPLKVDVIRDRGAMVREVEDGELENVYRLQVMNATESAHRYRIAVEGLPGIRVASEPVIDMAAASTRAFPVRIRVPGGAGRGRLAEDPDHRHRRGRAAPSRCGRRPSSSPPERTGIERRDRRPVPPRPAQALVPRTLALAPHVRARHRGRRGHRDGDRGVPRAPTAWSRTTTTSRASPSTARSPGTRPRARWGSRATSASRRESRASDFARTRRCRIA